MPAEDTKGAAAFLAAFEALLHEVGETPRCTRSRACPR